MLPVVCLFYLKIQGHEGTAISGVCNMCPTIHWMPFCPCFHGQSDSKIDGLSLQQGAATLSNPRQLPHGRGVRVYFVGDATDMTASLGLRQMHVIRLKAQPTGAVSRNTSSKLFVKLTSAVGCISTHFRLSLLVNCLCCFWKRPS